MRYCTCFIQDFYETLSYKNSDLNLNEPFKAFYQGMVCHETYKDAENNWVSQMKLRLLKEKNF